MAMTRVVLGMFAAGMLFVSAHTLASEDYPNKPVRIVTSAPGNSADISARFIAQGLTQSLGQPVIVDNRAYGNVSHEIVAKAPPDGYTLLVAPNQLLYGPLLQTMNYDPVRDFAPISLLGITPNILLVHPSLEANSVKELIALAKAKPGALNYASGGTGGTSHLAGELLKSLAGVNIVRVPYKGNAINAVVAGEVQITFENPTLSLPLAKTGKVKALAVTTAQPSVLAPGLPTIAESLPGYQMVSMTAAFAPAKTPVVVIGRLNRDIVRFANTPEAKQRFLSAGLEVATNSPEQLAAFVKSEMIRMGKVIKDAGIRVQ